MTEVVQRFLLKNTKYLQYVVNEKLAKRKGAIGRFFSWMEIGPRNYGQHFIPRWFRVMNTYFLNFGFRFNWGRPSVMKVFSREREIFIVGYAALFMVWAWYSRKNKMRPLYRYRDQLTQMSHKYGIFVPFNYMNFKISAHFIEINKIYHLEMMKKFYTVKDELKRERDACSDEEKKTRYITNKNYVYEKPGWLQNAH